jgi:hypothetical protein
MRYKVTYKESVIREAVVEAEDEDQACEIVRSDLFGDAVVDVNECVGQDLEIVDVEEA